MDYKEKTIVYLDIRVRDMYKGRIEIELFNNMKGFEEKMQREGVALISCIGGARYLVK